MRIHTNLGTRYFRKEADVNFVFGDLKKTPQINLALVYAKMNKISRRRCAYPPFWAPGISGTEADFILAFGDLENPRNNFRSSLYQDE